MLIELFLSRLLEFYPEIKKREQSSQVIRLLTPQSSRK